MTLNNLTCMIYKLLLACIFVFYSSNTLAAEPKPSIFNQEETAWLKYLQAPLRIGVTHIPNQVLRHKDGSHSGFSIDLFRKIESQLNIKFHWVYYNTWSELVEAGKNRDIDIIFSAQKTVSRQSHFYFTAPVLTQRNKIIVKGKPKKIEIEDLFGKSIAVSRGSAISEYLRINYPKIKQLLMETELSALEMAESGHVEAAISETVRATYHIKKHNFKGLRIAGDVGYDYQLRIASRNDMPILNIILEKAIEHISDEEKQALYLKWGYVKERVNYFDRQTLIYIGIALGLLIPFLITLTALNRSLRKEVATRRETEGLLTTTIDQLKNNEKELQQSRLLAEKANSAKTIFLANMSHELRNPLHAILGFSELLKESPKLSDENHEYNLIIHRSAVHLLNQLDDLFDISSIESGNIEPVMSEVNLDKILSDINSIFQKYTSEKSLNFHFEKSESVPEKIFADGRRIRQVLQNLLDNAVKYTNTGIVTLRAYVTNTNNKENRVDLCFEVEDTGNGINPEYQERVFGAFEQLHANQPGNGLGLAICRELAVQMGGSLVLNTSTEYGSLFSFTLNNVEVIASPTQNSLAAGEIKTKFVKKTTQQSLKGLRLLIVDDEELNQVLAKAFLSREGAIIEQAYSGVEAITTIQAKGLSYFSAVLMDVQMPRMNGIDTTRSIRALVDDINLPIIGLTAYTQQSEVEEMIAAGMNYHISKPVNFPELIVFLESCTLKKMT